MLKRSDVMNVIVLVFLSLLACNGLPKTNIESEQKKTVIPETVPNIRIFLDDGTSIPYVTAINQWNGKNIKRSDIFDKNGQIYSLESVFIPMDAKITLDFGDYLPEFVQGIYHEFDLSSSALVAHSVENTELTKITDSTYSFQQTQAITTIVSAKYPKPYGGYSFTVKYGDNICEYAFLFNTVNR